MLPALPAGCISTEVYRGAVRGDQKQAGSKFPEADGLSGLRVPLSGSGHSRQPSPPGNLSTNFPLGSQGRETFFLMQTEIDVIARLQCWVFKEKS